MKNLGNNLLWYREKARSWNEALPLGNGRIGGMVFGGAVQERISLNEDSLWSSSPSHCANPEALAAFQQARELALKRWQPDTERILENHFTGLWSQVYLPLGDLYLTMHHSN